ncbi:CUB and sushi domain-containing protein 3-like [Halichondria panicea]|uniref:CUB and sushi domain-containing protein 3-like n=1 Tax=Halichondria panicea TaxID=6063 RepID=UPI00312B6E01
MRMFPSRLLVCCLLGSVSLVYGQQTLIVNTGPTEPPTTCPDLTVPANGVISYNLGTASLRPVDTVATYTCVTGYTLDGVTTRTCGSDGVWSSFFEIFFLSGSGSGSGSPPNNCYVNTGPTETPTTCPDLTVPTNGVISYNMGTANLRPVDTVATYTCVTGYTLDGDTTRTCGSDGVWSSFSENLFFLSGSGSGSGSPPNNCYVIDCGDLFDPSNGAVNTSSGTTFMMTATYTCNTGYNLTGDMTRTCGANGTWSWTALTCDPVDCGSLSDPGNGIVDASNTTLMNTATYTCNTGYNLTGDTTRTCQANGTWSGTAACTPVDCGSLSDPGNGIVDASNTTFMNTATYNCNTGYNLTGDTTRTCQANGTWSGTAACTRKLIVFMISLLYLRI